MAAKTCDNTQNETCFSFKGFKIYSNRITKIDSWVPDFVFAWESKMRQNLHGMSTLPKDAVDAEAYQNSTFCVPNMFWVNYL